ncbi:MAG: M3 family oligoendopeptidase [Bacteroidetes bacterium]|nr:M3 family oligoendopeptidase [Bacteroidota bacterium]MBS1630491.1 M3 family oligoendopeptidase [Bacteroidota bacterium]
MIQNPAKPVAKTRQFLPQDFQITDWEHLQPFLDQLKARPIDGAASLHHWLDDISELEAVLSEDACWRQIRMTQDTSNPEYEQAFSYFVSEIEPKTKPYFFALNQMLAGSPFAEGLDKTKFFPYLRGVRNSIDLYREENIPLQAELSLLAQQYGVISSKMSIEHDGQEYTLQQAARFLQNPDRATREEVFRKIAARRLEDKAPLNELFEKLLLRRQQVAHNAGFENYRDYKFRELGRFDYTPDDCFRFHEAVRAHILPLQALLQQHRARRLGLEKLRPWDTDAEPADVRPLHPFHDGQELSGKAKEVFSRLRPFFGACLNTMQEMQRLDLDSRKAKAPGGYNCPLAETGVPFIFMNAAGTMSDVITMMHEGGHAVHSFLSHDLELSAFKEYPMEIAELASMSMELFSMKYWDVFYPDAEELQRARLDELERVISVLPWIATIDKFQHWLYTHVGHTEAEREQAWLGLLQEFSTGMVDWEGFDSYRKSFWQKQLHLYEVPFYYIEYGIAQLGAVAMWRQFRGQEQQALDNYSKALSLGYTQTLHELYETAGIRFDFSPAYVAELGSFLREALAELGLH